MILVGVDIVGVHLVFVEVFLDLVVVVASHRGAARQACGSSGATRAAWRFPFAVSLK